MNYKIQNSKPGDNWLKVEALHFAAWQCEDIEGQWNVVCLDLEAVISVSSKLEETPVDIKNNLLSCLEDCEIWDFNLADSEEDFYDLEDLKKRTTIFKFESILWVELKNDDLLFRLYKSLFLFKDINRGFLGLPPFLNLEYNNLVKGQELYCYYSFRDATFTIVVYLPESVNTFAQVPLSLKLVELIEAKDLRNLRKWLIILKGA